MDNQTTRPQTADIIQLKLSLLKKLVTQARAEKNFISYANSKEEQKGVAAEEFLIRSDRRCMQLFYAFECKLIEFQQPLYRHAQLSQTDNFWIFNGGWQLRDTETIHSKSFMVQLHLMSVTAYRRQLKHVVQFWKAKGDFDELIKAFTVKCQRTDHTLDAHFTDISTVHNFEQPLAGLSHWLERLKREEKDSSKYRTSRWQRGKEIITFKR